VVVNGLVILDPAYGVGECDHIELDGKTLTLPAPGELTYIMLHKPAGVVSTMSPGRERGASLADLVELPQRLHPVGRLDRDSSGLILLTNDGDLTHRLTHPRHRIQKEYLAKLNRPLTPRDFKRIARGVRVDGRVVEVDVIGPARGGRIQMTIHEGRNRIVRRLFGEIGYRVLELKRVRIGPVRLGRLTIGHWRRLRPAEVKSLKVA